MPAGKCTKSLRTGEGTRPSAGEGATAELLSSPVTAYRIEKVRAPRAPSRSGENVDVRVEEIPRGLGGVAGGGTSTGTPKAARAPDAPHRARARHRANTTHRPSAARRVRSACTASARGPRLDADSAERNTGSWSSSIILHDSPRWVCTRRGTHAAPARLRSAGAGNGAFVGAGGAIFEAEGRLIREAPRGTGLGNDQTSHVHQPALAVDRLEVTDL